MAIFAQLVDDVVVHKFDLNSKTVTFGRHPDNDVVIDDDAVSAEHARTIHKENAHFPDFKEYFIEDLGSTNGTYINEMKVVGKQRLHHNDVIRFAWNKFKFMDSREADLERTLQMLQNSQAM